ncbi:MULTISPECIES: hypothetical protein [unclassified Sinorhizobium]|uniref:hypothetical protein n=1 Tax=unclassified Sinorhizobium TaxID=2613772 RepID=UPI003526BCC1
MSTLDLGDDDPIPLAEAARIFFHGRLTKSALRTEAAKGNLEVIRIANKDFVTRNGINRMVEKCRRKSDQQGSGLGQTLERGSSRMEGSASAQNALRTMLQARKQNSQNTSQKTTGRSAEVVPLK